MSDLKIIKMEEEHLEEVLKLHKVAFKDYPSTKLGDLYIRKMLKWFVLNKEAINYCAFWEEEMAGYVVGAPDGYRNHLNKTLFLPALFSMLRNFYLIFDARIIRKIIMRFKDLFTRKPFEKFSEDKIFVLVGIGVKERFYGKGIAQNLIKIFEQDVLKRQFNAVRLSVFSDNIRAIKFYEKMDYIKIMEKKDYMEFYKKLENYEK